MSAYIKRGPIVFAVPKFFTTTAFYDEFFKFLPVLKRSQFAYLLKSLWTPCQHCQALAGSPLGPLYRQDEKNSFQNRIYSFQSVFRSKLLFLSFLFIRASPFSQIFPNCSQKLLDGCHPFHDTSLVLCSNDVPFVTCGSEAKQLSISVHGKRGSGKFRFSSRGRRGSRQLPLSREGPRLPPTLKKRRIIRRSFSYLEVAPT